MKGEGWRGGSVKGEGVRGGSVKGEVVERCQCEEVRRIWWQYLTGRLPDTAAKGERGPRGVE